MSWKACPVVQYIEYDYDRTMNPDPTYRGRRMIAIGAREAGNRIQPLLKFKNDHETSYDGRCFVCMDDGVIIFQDLDADTDGI